MSITRPELTTIRSRIQADIESRLPGASPQLRRTLLGILASVFTGGMNGIYGYFEWISEQMLPDTAEAEMLDRHASIWGIVRKAAALAQGNVTFTGTNGSVIAAGTLLQRSDSVQFSTDAEGTIASGTALVAVTAVVAGTDGNTAAASTLSLVSPVSGVNSAATVDGSGITNGTETELDADLLARLLTRIREAPHGGAEFDYPVWAKEVAGVTRAWVYPQELGIGTVTVRFVVDDDPGGLIPDAAKVTEVQDYIDSVRPVTADVTVVAPIDTPLDMTIALTPNDATVKAAVEAELADLISREAVPGGTILLSHLREAISIAAGETNHDLTVPAADVTHTTGKIATLGTITWA